MSRFTLLLLCMYCHVMHELFIVTVYIKCCLAGLYCVSWNADVVVIRIMCYTMSVA